MGTLIPLLILNGPAGSASSVLNADPMERIHFCVIVLPAGRRRCRVQASNVVMYGHKHREGKTIMAAQIIETPDTKRTKRASLDPGNGLVQTSPALATALSLPHSRVQNALM
jgi:hypothetical protein